MRYLIALLIAFLMAGSVHADAEWSESGVVSHCRYKLLTPAVGAGGEALDFGSGSAGWLAPGSRARIVKIRNQGPDNLLWEGVDASSVSFSELTTPAAEAASDASRLDPDVGSGIEIVNGVAWTGLLLQNEDEDEDGDAITVEVWWCY